MSDRERRGRRAATLGVAAVALAGSACSGDRSSSPPGAVYAPPLRHPEETPALLDALRRGITWAESIDAHPVRLREERGMKGVKHFAEWLDVMLMGFECPLDPELSSRAREAALRAWVATDSPIYHDLRPEVPARFREDSMSYLRVCWLGERFGFDTVRYRREIDRLLPAIQRHLPGRGIDQRMGFALLLADLGLPRTETESQVYPISLVARRVPVEWFLESPDRPYDLTHEIFAMTGRGRRPFPFRSREEETHAIATVTELLRRTMDAKNLDVAAELLVNLAQLGEGESSWARAARAWILESQNADGSFGAYDAEAAKAAKGNPAYDVRVGGYLHTTMVCLWASIVTS